LSSGMLCVVVWCKLTYVSEVLFAFIIRACGAYCLHLQSLMMEAVHTSETLVINLYQTTRRNIPQEQHFQLLFTVSFVTIAVPLFITHPYSCDSVSSLLASSIRLVAFVS